jgi:hypothetical protein
MNLNKYHLLFILILILILIFLYNTPENFTLTTQSNEGIQNLTSVYNNNKITVTNLDVTGNSNLHNLDVSGSLHINNNSVMKFIGIYYSSVFDFYISNATILSGNNSRKIQFFNNLKLNNLIIGKQIILDLTLSLYAMNGSVSLLPQINITPDANIISPVSNLYINPPLTHQTKRWIISFIPSATTHIIDISLNASDNITSDTSDLSTLLIYQLT